MWTSPDGQHQNQIDYILCSWRWRSSIQSAKTRPQSMNSFLPNSDLKKVEKTTRPFRYDLNQVPYDYTVEMTNRFKGLDLIECLENYGQRFMTLYRRQGSRSSQEKEARWLSEEAVQIVEKGREAKGKGEKERCTHLNAQFQRIARRDKKVLWTS